MTTHLKKRIEEQGFKHCWLARELGISATHFNNIVNNRFPLLPIYWDKLRKHVKITVEEIEDDNRSYEQRANQEKARFRKKARV